MGNILIIKARQFTSQSLLAEHTGFQLVLDTLTYDLLLYTPYMVIVIIIGLILTQMCVTSAHCCIVIVLTSIELLK